ncbi:DUF58 domain-containing protein [Salinibacterium sp. G-O1]|uniref:DUF58 domain-containing protein n=1 Tax=Salinibacterium sp. G-O1 TaxID=3046208 RepID=UPI0024B87F82|nr:DUF58 domain-containing protein [Salinibacterium sp. G-O1]MDJ0335740.1 DUF58 domain-containing protein [Salinibacterium sp. G-O1]
MRRKTRGGITAGFRRVGLTQRGVAFVVASAIAFVVAYVLGFQQLLYVAIALAALPLIALVLVRVRRPKLSVTRSFSPHVIEAGSTATVSLLVHNLTGAPTLRVRWWDEVPWVSSGTVVGELLGLQPRGARYSRGNTAALEYELRPPRRGIFNIGPFVVHLSDAFGFASTTYSVGQAQEVVVTPEVVALPETSLSVSAGDGEARIVQRRSAGDADDSITREYRTGDAMRRVHWRATARHGDLMVRQEEHRSFPEAGVILDTRGIGYDDLSGDERTGYLDSDSFEWAVSMLASVAVHLRRYGFLVKVQESGPPQLGRHPAPGRTRHDEELLTELAELRLTITSTSALDMSRSVDKGRGSNGPIVAIVGNPDSQTVEWMMRQRRPGDVAVVFMVQGASGLGSLDPAVGSRLSKAIPVTTKRLTDAGWIVIPVRSDDDHAAAWEAVEFQSGRSHVGR